MYAAMLFALGLLLWGQGNLWNAGLRRACRTGSRPQRRTRGARRTSLRHGPRAAARAGVFFGPSAASRRLPRSCSWPFRPRRRVSGAIRPRRQRVRWIEPPPAIYQFSPAQNVIHIVLDEFQSDVFNDILQQDRASLDRQFSGFQYFADHAGSFPTTSFSMPAMLAGQEYRNQKPAPEFVREAFKQISILEKVSRAGYDIDATTIVPLDSFEQWMGPEAAPNWKGARFRIRKPFVSREDYREVSARQLLELSLFRHVPHTAKAFSVDRPGRVLPPDLDGSNRIAGTGETARGQQFGGIPRAVHRLDDRGTRSSRIQAAARRRAPPPDRRRSRMPVHRHDGRCRGKATRSNHDAR